MRSIRSLKVLSRIGNRETEYRTEIDLNPCLVSENILLDEGSYDHLSMDRTDWVRVRQQFLGSYRFPFGTSHASLTNTLNAKRKQTTKQRYNKNVLLSAAACDGEVRDAIITRWSRFHHVGNDRDPYHEDAAARIVFLILVFFLHRLFLFFLNQGWLRPWHGSFRTIEKIHNAFGEP
ncbi:hypothetical protein L2E82_24579 [Cichorium intybus]|uniref:Uncharacterized protein n=1 Tax=Cichorium intybus TaxID=13427 RepID=A0ACB9E1I3_CICIN|nr:hypothetical protein L2E82_24579 [Cichorium intybus]